MAIYYKGQRMDGGNASGGGNGGVPPGFIGMWSGAADAVPDGWHICDGTEGTPDLRGRFVLGVNESHELGETGGEEEVTLTVEQMPTHSHGIKTISGPSTIREMFVSLKDSSKNYGDSAFESGYMTNSGKNKPHNNLPPYYALCYIMKL